MSELDPLVGHTIDGKYRLDAVVGSGSMGTVYRATQLTLSKRVAIKVMRRDLTHEPAYVVRFKREAKAASRLDHPNSLRIIDCGDDGGLLYIAMEFIDGRDLLAVLQQEWPLSSARVVDILSQALAGLAVAHEAGIVHRDLKPENVMVIQGTDDEGGATETVKVCDFGVAKLLPTKKDDSRSATAAGTLTALGVLIGTPEYMSPEQVLGEELDARSDLYALGIILYQILTRRLPFEEKSPIQLAMRHVDTLPPPPSRVVATVDRRLEAVCLRALRKARDERYASAREMRSDLRGLSAPGSQSGNTVSSSARVVPRGESEPTDIGSLSKAATLLAEVSPHSLAAARRPQDETTADGRAVDSALDANIPVGGAGVRSKARWLAIAAIALAVGLLLLFAR
jgi:eukaryotic-like serine/threonine-protein kinase